MKWLFHRHWESPTPAMNFNPLAIGVSFLVNIGWGGPEGEVSPEPLATLTCTHLHQWPPFGMTPTTRRHLVLRQALTPATEGLANALYALSQRPDDRVFTETILREPEAQLTGQGICLAPAIEAGDTLTERDGPIAVGDFVVAQLRGSLQPLVKVYAGTIDRDGERMVLLYLRQPEQVIEVAPADILYARRIDPVRTMSGSDLLAAADTFVTSLPTIPEPLQPVGASRREAWLLSLLTILQTLREQPE